jgi:outer membrane lipopolysaccharide assembly protein LptE/RlpB
MSESVRRILLSCALAVLATTIAGCGFQPRGQATEIAVIPGPVHISGIGQYTELYRELAAQLRSAGVATTTDRAASAIQLRVIDYERDSRLLTVDSQNRRVETELEQSVQFEVRNSAGEQLAAPQTVRVLRIQFQPADDVLARRREAELQREDMHRELVQRVLQRVAAQR